MVDSLTCLPLCHGLGLLFTMFIPNRSRIVCRIPWLQVYIEDLREEFVTDFVFEAVKANAVYEGRYLLGTRCVLAVVHLMKPFVDGVTVWRGDRSWPVILVFVRPAILMFSLYRGASCITVEGT